MLRHARILQIASGMGVLGYRSMKIRSNKTGKTKPADESLGASLKPVELKTKKDSRTPGKAFISLMTRMQHDREARLIQSLRQALLNQRLKSSPVVDCKRAYREAHLKALNARRKIAKLQAKATTPAAERWLEKKLMKAIKEEEREQAKLVATEKKRAALLKAAEKKQKQEELQQKRHLLRKRKNEERALKAFKNVIGKFRDQRKEEIKKYVFRFLHQRRMELRRSELVKASKKAQQAKQLPIKQLEKKVEKKSRRKAMIALKPKSRTLVSTSPSSLVGSAPSVERSVSEEKTKVFQPREEDIAKIVSSFTAAGTPQPEKQDKTPEPVSDVEPSTSALPKPMEKVKKVISAASKLQKVAAMGKRAPHKPAVSSSAARPSQRRRIAPKAPTKPTTKQEKMVHKPPFKAVNRGRKLIVLKKGSKPSTNDSANAASPSSKFRPSMRKQPQSLAKQRSVGTSSEAPVLKAKSKYLSLLKKEADRKLALAAAEQSGQLQRGTNVRKEDLSWHVPSSSTGLFRL